MSINIALICERKNVQIRYKYKMLKEEFKNNKYKKYDIKLYNNIYDGVKLDMVVLIANNVLNITKKYHLFDLKLNSIPIYLIISDLKTENISRAIDLTRYVSYIKNSNERIVIKVLFFGFINFFDILFKYIFI